MLGEFLEQPPRLVATSMPDEIVEGRPLRWVQWHREQKRRARRSNARQFRQRTIIVIDMLDDVERADEIEDAIAKRER